MKNFLLKLSCLFTGSDYSKVSVCPEFSKNKISALARSLFFPSLLWFSIGLMMGMVYFDLNIYASVVVALFLSGLIYSFDRALIMMSKNKLSFFVRGFLGGIIAILGAFFTDGIIFNNDITQIMNQDRLHQKEKTLAEITESENRELEDIKNEINKAETEWLIAQNDIKSEADGTGGSMTRGVDKVVLIKQDVALNLKRKIDELKNEKNKIEEKIAIKMNAIEESYVENTLLIRFKYMKDFILNDRFIIFISSLIFLFFASIEFFVLMYKYNTVDSYYEIYNRKAEEIMKNRLNRLAQSDEIIFNPIRQKSSEMQMELIKKLNHNNYN